MHVLPTVLAIAVAAAPPFARPRPFDVLLVREVVDGGTIDVATIGRVRLLGIEAPRVELRGDTRAPVGWLSRERLAALVLRRWVRLEYDASVVGPTRRHLAYVVRDDGLFVNAVLLREGLARVSRRPPVARLEELKDAEREAQRFHRGIWEKASPQMPQPRSWRAGDVASKPRDRYTANSGTPQKPNRTSSRKRRRRTRAEP